MGGKTSHGYSGLTWTWDVTPRIFLEAGLEGAFHNGNTQLIAPAARNAMDATGASTNRVRSATGSPMPGARCWTVEHTSNSRHLQAESRA